MGRGRWGITASLEQGGDAGVWTKLLVFLSLPMEVEGALLFDPLSLGLFLWVLYSLRVMFSNMRLVADNLIRPFSEEGVTVTRLVIPNCLKVTFCLIRNRELNKASIAIVFGQPAIFQPSA
ncbi:hypothetical protein M440DRAFT_235133 [Trichoderma longibrachiatum ATCC 18648]|uniref:Uncharacterized protein n=1 Tax=Trichoderma longibrachiatum ATCC 18648 TaxID=983965 RepID=A0A2T4CCQ1_TRILO|nr:hypothetical protein M440DRAFT_235133 [Trichoderma longibrachiatum ATCC 18648]